jgi:WD40 repeat protein
LQGTSIFFTLLEPITARAQKIEVSNLSFLTELARWEIDTNSVPAVAFSPDGSRLAYSDPAGHILSLTTRTGGELVEYIGLKNHIAVRLAFSQDSQILAGVLFKRGYSVDEDVSVLRWWAAEEENVLRTIWLPLGVTLNGLAFSPDGRLVLASDNHGYVHAWLVKDGSPLYTTRLGNSALVFTPSGQELLVLSGTRINVVDWVTGEILRSITPPEPNRRLVSLALSPNGSTLAAGTLAEDDRAVIYVWQTSSGKLLHTLVGHSDHVYHLAFGMDSRLLVSGGFVLNDNTTRFWDTLGGVELKVWAGDAAVFFSPDGRLMGLIQRGSIRWWGVVAPP